MLTKESVLSHPHLNPAFAAEMARRLSVQSYNRKRTEIMPAMRVPKQPNRYLAHVGAKEMARHEGAVSLGPNASRVLNDPLYMQTEQRISRVISTGEEALAGIADAAMIDQHPMIGQTVTWTSSNLEKTGEIVAVVPAGQHPSIDLTPKVKEPGAPRDHDSYVVKSNGKHYWPRVSLLSIA